MSRDRLLVALRLGDVAKVVGMVEGADLDALVSAADMQDEVWPSPMPEGVVTMITLQGVHGLMKAKGDVDAQAFSTWLDEEFRENALFSSLSDDELLSENLYRIGEIRQENPGIQTCEIASRLSILEDDAQRYVSYLDLLRELK
ncbi:hypothetical protein [Pandoraea cepalis]|nr:hypothetical protein [Pandoraea cepalis]